MGRAASEVVSAGTNKRGSILRAGAFDQIRFGLKRYYVAFLAPTLPAAGKHRAVMTHTRVSSIRVPPQRKNRKEKIKNIIRTHNCSKRSVLSGSFSCNRPADDSIETDYRRKREKKEDI